jgi:hypothetical protein
MQVVGKLACTLACKLACTQERKGLKAEGILEGKALELGHSLALGPGMGLGMHSRKPAVHHNIGCLNKRTRIVRRHLLLGSLQKFPICSFLYSP